MFARRKETISLIPAKSFFNFILERLREKFCFYWPKPSKCIEVKSNTWIYSFSFSFHFSVLKRNFIMQMYKFPSETCSKNCSTQQMDLECECECEYEYTNKILCVHSSTIHRPLLKLGCSRVQNIIVFPFSFFIFFRKKKWKCTCSSIFDAWIFKFKGNVVKNNWRC